MQVRTFRDRIIAYKKDSKYLAISLEFDLFAEGNSIIEALKRLRDASSGYLEMCCKENEPDSEVYRAAPKKYQDMYSLFVDLSEKKRKKASEKKKEERLMKKEVSSALWTYNSANLCNA